MYKLYRYKMWDEWNFKIYRKIKFFREHVDISHAIPREAINARSLRETFRVVPDKHALRHMWNTLEGVRGETCSAPTGAFIFASEIPQNRTSMRTRAAYKSSGWLRALGTRPINGTCKFHRNTSTRWKTAVTDIKNGEGEQMRNEECRIIIKKNMEKEAGNNSRKLLLRKYMV